MRDYIAGFSLALSITLSTHVLSEVPGWTADSAYLGGDVVQYEGNYWLANHWSKATLPPEASEWTKIFPPRPFVPWQTSMTYEKGDFVEYRGKRFVARHHSFNTAPNPVDEWGVWKEFTGSDLIDITINLPDEAQLDSDRVTLSGSVKNVSENASLTLLGFIPVQIRPNGTFETVFVADNGPNPFQLTVKDGDRAHDISRTVYWNDPNVVAKAMITEQGGSVTSDLSSPLKGLKLNVPGGMSLFPYAKEIGLGIHDHKDCRIKGHSHGAGERTFVAGYTPYVPEFFSYPPTTILDNNVTLEVPNTDGKGLIAYAYNGDLKEKLTSSHSNGITTFYLDSIFHSYVDILAPPTTLPNERVITAEYDRKVAIYDGSFFLGHTPLKLTENPNHQPNYRAFVEGYDEVYFALNEAKPVIDIALTPQSNDTGPSFTLNAPTNEPITVNQSLFVVKGQLDLATGQEIKMVARINGNDYMVHPNQSGFFESVHSLFVGKNEIVFRSTDEAGSTYVSDPIIVNYDPNATTSLLRLQEAFRSYTTITESEEAVLRKQAKSKAEPRPTITRSTSESIPSEVGVSSAPLTITLDWSSYDTDVDLHVWDENGNHAWYGSLAGIPGANLDHDDVDGYGPEIFTMALPKVGRYKVKLHYFSDHGNGNTAATVTYYSDGKLVTARRNTTLSNGQWWTLPDIIVDELAIKEVLCSNCDVDEGQFVTTDPIQVVLTEAASSLAKDPVLKITELTENFEVPEANITYDAENLRFDVTLINKQLEGLANPRHSQALEFEMLVEYENSDGTIQHSSCLSI